MDSKWEKLLDIIKTLIWIIENIEEDRLHYENQVKVDENGNII